QYATADGTAVAGEDYVATNGTLTFAPGETAKTVIVPVSGDVAVEPTQTFLLNLSSPTNGVLGDATGVAAITNDDLGRRAVAAAGQPVRVMGYAGDGAVTLADGTAPAVLLGTFDPLGGTGRRWVQLDPVALSALFNQSSFVGLRFEAVADTQVQIGGPTSANPP